MLMICSAVFSRAMANETEPNNDRNSANTLALNSSDNGAINPAGDQDWWKLTTTGDGGLSITLTPPSGIYMWVYLYDNDGTTVLNSSYSNAAFTQNTDGLAAGTYYIKIICYNGTDIGSYTISNTLTQPAQANDTEPNGSRAQAKVFPLNGSKTGHINYYYNNQRDSADWYKITTAGDGRLDITFASNNGQYIRCWLYDNDGITQLNYSEISGTVVQTTDGLAAGTYYIKITSYYGGGFIPYTISNIFTAVAQANDTEPNNTKAQALTLGLNNSTTGHINYYYNNTRDVADWYKVTTTADGRLRLRITPANGQYIRCWLYDNDGTTQLNYAEPSTTADLNTDGLAAGTYYILIQSYYGNGYIPYTLSDSLFSPTEPNDAEPNSTLAQAAAFSLNSTKTGHINYYYNLLRDSADWYKITTTLDGMIGLTITSGNGQYVRVWLYDNNGTTQLNYMEPSGMQTINTDGLAAGTYYVRIQTYYANDAAAEPNDAPYQAKTIPANGNVTGHVNFYQNGGTRNTADWWKINYTGSGNLTVNLYDEAWKSTGGTHYKKIWIYKDTAASQIYYAEPAGDLTINLTSLTQGYYWIKVTSYFGGEHIAYSLSNTFTQVNIANISITQAINGDCATGQLQMQGSGSQPPYTVKLYRFGTLYNTYVTNQTGGYTASNLPPGTYYATAFGDGATGSAFGTSNTKNLLPPATTTVSETNITSTAATVRYNKVTCANGYVVQWRKQGTTIWSQKIVLGNKDSLKITGLAAATTYQWRVAVGVGLDTLSTYVLSAFSAVDQFTTAASFASSNGSRENMIGSNTAAIKVSVAPNPAVNNIRIVITNIKQGVLSASLVNAFGKTVWRVSEKEASAFSNMLVDVSRFPAGIYTLQIMDESGNLNTEKIVISR